MSNKQFKARHGFNTNAASNLASIQISTGNVNVDAGSVVLANGGFYTGNSTVNASMTAGSILINGSVLSPGGAVPGSNTQVMFNDSGSSNAVSSFTYNKSTNILNIGAGTANSQVAQTYIYTANSTAGATITPGSISLTGSGGTLTMGPATFVANGADLVVYRSGGTTGYVVLNAAGTRYLGYDATNYLLNGTNLYINGGLAWHGGNDGSGSGLDADLLDGYNSDAFARLAGSPTFTTKIISSVAPGIATMANNTGSAGGLELQNNSTGPAIMSFHRASAYAAYLGIDTDNVWKVGGWSMGSVAYKIWHEGSDGSGSGLDADLLDGYDSTAFARLAASPAFTGGALTVSVSGGGSVSLNAGAATTTGYIGFSNTSGSRKCYLGYAAQGSTISFVCNENSATGLDITGNTNVTGTLTSTSTCTASAFNTSSDARLKKKKRKIKESDFIEIDYMAYDMYNTDKEFIGHHYGALAQDVEKTHPHLIDTDEKGFRRLNYTSLHTLEIAKLLKMMETQNKYIEKLEKRLSKLEGKK